MASCEPWKLPLDFFVLENEITNHNLYFWTHLVKSSIQFSDNAKSLQNWKWRQHGLLSKSIDWVLYRGGGGIV